MHDQERGSSAHINYVLLSPVPFTEAPWSVILFGDGVSVEVTQADEVFWVNWCFSERGDWEKSTHDENPV